MLSISDRRDFPAAMVVPVMDLFRQPKLAYPPQSSLFGCLCKRQSCGSDYRWFFRWWVVRHFRPAQPCRLQPTRLGDSFLPHLQRWFLVFSTSTHNKPCLRGRGPMTKALARKVMKRWAMVSSPHLRKETAIAVSYVAFPWSWPNRDYIEVGFLTRSASRNPVFPSVILYVSRVIVASVH